MDNIRLLNAGEIDCRIGTISKDGKGLSLLLYKDARCDMNILDEVFGAMNWKRAHSRDNKNCTVSIWDADKREWVSKEDTGTESNTEAEKGLASDSFKRACFNWGIGRELYTAPFIWIPADKCDIKKDQKGNLKCYDNFVVNRIGYNSNREINDLAIMNTKTGAVVFDLKRPAAKPLDMPKEKHGGNEAQKFECECCGAILEPYIGADGKEVSIRKHEMGSRAKFRGHLYCVTCITSGRIQEGA